MTKINPYDLPADSRHMTVVLKNIEWDTDSRTREFLPKTMTIPLSGDIPEIDIVSRALDAASAAQGFCVLDCDVEPIQRHVDAESEVSDSTLEYVGDIYTNDL